MYFLPLLICFFQLIVGDLRFGFVVRKKKYNFLSLSWVVTAKCFSAPLSLPIDLSVHVSFVIYTRHSAAPRSYIYKPAQFERGFVRLLRKTNKKKKECDCNSKMMYKEAEKEENEESGMKRGQRGWRRERAFDGTLEKRSDTFWVGWNGRKYLNIRKGGWRLKKTQ